MPGGNYIYLAFRLRKLHSWTSKRYKFHYERYSPTNRLQWLAINEITKFLKYVRKI